MATRDVPELELRRAQVTGYQDLMLGESKYLFIRQLEPDRSVFLLPMFAGNLRLGIGDPRSPFMDDGWCYQAEQTDLAWKAALGWDGEGEPEGWYRHPETGRRRPGGDPAKEHVHG